MNQKSMKWFLLVLALGALMTLGACGKKATPPPPPPPPPPPAPTASISVSPNTIQGGQSASLTWQTTDATDVSIDGIGAVQPNGSQSLSPGRQGLGRQPGSHCAAYGKPTAATAAANNSVGVGGRFVQPECEGRLLRLRQVRHSWRPAVFAAG